jgi:pimeloyl-ACP methyl ester carboxylesterase
VYLITGGTGGIGLSIAKYLASACGPKIVMTKKTPFPRKANWREMAASPATPDTVRSTLEALIEIERLGAEVEVLVAESSDRGDMKRALEAAQARFGTINGVIHAAGIVRAGLIQAKTKAVAESVLAPKVTGTMVLFDLLKDARLDFLVLFSSITSVIAPYAEADYSGANSFLDAFAPFANANGKFHTLTINWPGWKEIGQLADLEVRPGLEGWKEAALDKAILTKDGLEAFKRALNADLAQVVVCPEDLDALVSESWLPFDYGRYSSQPQHEASAPSRPREEKGTAGHAAGNVEAEMHRIWSGVLGVDRIDAQDNFSQLGGHSLLAMQVVAEIRRTFRVDFTLREFFEAPTIAQSSGAVHARARGDGTARARDQALSVLSPMGQRAFSASSVPAALFVGPPDRQVFVAYHPPIGAGGNVLTVICPPLFNEYMRTQLALRELAISLAEAGQHVLRFDYRGTGDSSGDLVDVSFPEWIEDVALVVSEGRRRSGCEVVRLLGVRAGALVACKSAAACGDVERWVLWDPVPDGGQYLQSLRHIQATVIEKGRALGPRELNGWQEFAGYRLSSRMAAELASLDVTTYADLPRNKLRVVSTSQGRESLVEGVDDELAEFLCNWESDLENLMMPKPVLERLGTCLM